MTHANKIFLVSTKQNKDIVEHLRRQVLLPVYIVMYKKVELKCGINPYVFL